MELDDEEDDDDEDDDDELLDLDDDDDDEEVYEFLELETLLWRDRLLSLLSPPLEVSSSR